MELDFFKSALQFYMKEHGFDNEDCNHPIVQANADNAWEAFDTLRKNGANPNDALNEAMRENLYVNIGESPREIIAAILVNHYQDRLDISQPVFLDHWVKQVMKSHIVLAPFKLEYGIGLDPEKVSIYSYDALRERIDKFFSIYGL